MPGIQSKQIESFNEEVDWDAANIEEIASTLSIKQLVTAKIAELQAQIDLLEIKINSNNNGNPGGGPKQ